MTLVENFIEVTRIAHEIVNASSDESDTCSLEILMNFERILDRCRMLIALNVPIEERIGKTEEIAASMDMLRGIIFKRLQSLPTEEAEAFLHARVQEAQMSWHSALK